MPPELLGPFGLLIALGIAVGVLWRDHLRADADDRVQRDLAITGWKEATAAINRLSAALERRNKNAAKGRADDD